MNAAQLKTLLARLSAGEIDTAEAEQQLLAAFRARPYEDLGFARVDHHRSVRQGFPEVIFGAGKTDDQIGMKVSGGPLAKEPEIVIESRQVLPTADPLANLGVEGLNPHLELQNARRKPGVTMDWGTGREEDQSALIAPRMSSRAAEQIA
jgi:hypothetical protein